MTFAPPLDWGPVDAARARPRPIRTRWRSRRPGRRTAFAERLGECSDAAPARAAGGVGGRRGHRAGAGRRRSARCDAPTSARSASAGAAAALAAMRLLAAGVQRAGALSLRRHPARRAAGPAPGRRHRGRRGGLLPVGARRRGRRPARAAERAQVLVVASPSVADLLARACPPGRAAGAAGGGPDHGGGGARVGLAARRRWPTGPTAEALAVAGGRWSPARDASEAHERSLPPRLPARAGRAAARLDDAPGRPLSPRVSRGAASAPTSSPWCGTPELAVEVTLQPVDLLGVDAAIIFSDILVVPQAMGMALSVEEGIGPRFHQPLRSPADFERLRDVRARGAIWATCSTRCAWRGASSTGGCRSSDSRARRGR